MDLWLRPKIKEMTLPGIEDEDIQAISANEIGERSKLFKFHSCHTKGN